ncbi:hypothetical protein CLAIMM_06490 [Cladophialophora immunda]|nr:hypothetical protein CLAIMM_06490 [Cladophialophora immunda]
MVSNATRADYSSLRSVGHLSLLSKPKESNRSRTYRSSVENNSITWKFALFHDFAATLRSWVLKAQRIVQSTLCFRTNPKPDTIQLLVNGQPLNAFKDTGSEKSCIDHVKALELGLELSYETDAQASFRLPNGKVISSVAVTWADCFPADNQPHLCFRGRFFVFQALHFPMILGNDLLDKAGEIKRSEQGKLGAFAFYAALGRNARYLKAILDTGTEVNMISKEALTSLGEQPNSALAAPFFMANGRQIESIGQVTLKFCFPGEQASQNAKFEVFENLTVPVVVGAKLADQRIKFRWVFRPKPSDPLVTHVARRDHRPVRLFRCIVNGKRETASADTGSDLNLVSPLAATRLANASSMDECKLDITLADGSKAAINASFAAEFSPYSAPEEITMERFYVLEGLAPDIIISRTTLETIGAFTRNQASFFEQPENSPLYNLNVAAYLSRPAARFLRFFKTGRRARSTTDTSSSKPTLQILPSPSATDSEFYSTLKIVAAYMTNLREKAKREIAHLTGIQRAVAEDAENWRIDRYEADLRRRLDERRQAARSGS